MGKRNIYQDIVITGAIILCIFFLAGKAKAWLQAQELRGMGIQAGNDLTADLIAEFEKLPGITLFTPADTVLVKAELGEYTLETELMGISLSDYPLQWETADPKITLGNTAMLLVGKDCFASFSDRNGYPPTKSQVEKWQQDYSQLEITLSDENGRSHKAKICGILKAPSAKICMEKSQMEEVFADLSHTKGGYLQIQGAQNAQKAQQLLEAAGFQVAEE